MAVSVGQSNRSIMENNIKRLAAGLIVLSFIVITVSVLGVQAPLGYQMLYITFDSLIVYVVIRMLQWVATKILIIYEEIEGGQN